VAKVAQKVVAAAVYILRARGASVELSLNAYNAAVWVINNTIASKNNSNVGGLAWTVVTNNTLIKEQCIAIIYASNVAEWRLKKLTAIETAVKAWATAQIAALQQKVAEFKVQAAAKLDALKTAWASAAVKAELAQRFAAFLNASGVSVQIVTTTANVTVNVAIAKLNLTATYTAQEVKNWLAKHIKILLLAYAGAELGGIAEDQVPLPTTTSSSSFSSLIPSPPSIRFLLLPCPIPFSSSSSLPPRLHSPHLSPSLRSPSRRLPKLSPRSVSRATVTTSLRPSDLRHRPATLVLPPRRLLPLSLSSPRPWPPSSSSERSL